MSKLPVKTIKTPKNKRIKLDRLALAKKWKMELGDGKYKNQSELAMCNGVSRAWVCRVLGVLK
ncbi:hypothetical protein KAJ27_13975 [bacterium]|nr:hypothetical protein [bacterium]